MLLTQEQEMIRDAMREFARERLAPFAAEWDRKATFPKEALAELAGLGAFGMAVPERWGGAGMDYVSLALALEEIAAGDGATSTIISVNNSVVCGPILAFGTDAQKERFLKPLASGAQLGCFCLTEPHVGSDAAAIRTSAVRDGNEWVLNGVKQFITSGKHAQVAIVFAVTDKTAGKKGISAFIVPTDAPGYVVARVEEKMGQHASDTAQILLENCRVPAAESAGRGRRRLPHRPGQPGGRPHRHRRPVGRHGARGLRGGAEVRPGARGLRQAHHRTSGGELPPRRHGHAHRGGAPAGAARRASCATPASPA
ncbi:hypothetical protein MASR1M97_22740 [Candidatus Desulfobacillus denitrificans]